MGAAFFAAAALRVADVICVRDGLPGFAVDLCAKAAAAGMAVVLFAMVFAAGRSMVLSQPLTMMAMIRERETNDRRAAILRRGT